MGRILAGALGVAAGAVVYGYGLLFFQAQNPAPIKNPAPINISFQSGECIDPSMHEFYVLEKGDNPWVVAVNTLRQGEDLGERFAQIMRMNHIDEKRGLPDYMERDSTLLQEGSHLVTRNNGKIPELYVPKELVVLEEGQQFTLELGLEGLLCGSQARVVSAVPKGARFSGGNTFEWTPSLYQAGEYSIIFAAGDQNTGVYAKLEMVVRGNNHEFVTDSENPVKYFIIGTDNGIALSLDNKSIYMLDSRAKIGSWLVREREMMNPKDRFVSLQKKASGYDLAKNPDWTEVLDHIRRAVETDGHPEAITPYHLDILPWYVPGYVMQSLPVLGKKLQ